MACGRLDMDDDKEKGQVVHAVMRQTFIMFFLRDQAQANAGPSEVKDTGRAPGKK